MKKVIAAIRVISFPVLTLLIYMFYLFILIFIKITGKRYESWRNRCMRLWGKGTAKIFSMEIIVEGTPPEPPFFIVSNHLSYIDIPVYSSVIKTTFVSKAEVRGWPLVGFMAKTLGIIFIDRRKRSDVSRVNKEISDQLNDLQGVILFPEGTTSPGSEILPFRASLLQHAAETETDVSFAAIRYETSENDLSAHKSVCWWGNTPMLKHLFLMGQNKKIITTIKIGDHTVKNSDRKALAEELQQQVEELFHPVIDRPEKSFEPLKF